MRQPLLWRTAIWSILTTGILVWTTDTARAAAEDSAMPDKPASAEKISKFRGRLPAYYGMVVSEEQRQQIYDIQKEYHPQIAALKAQLKALVQQRNAKVEAVLTTEQREKVDAARAAAKAKRAQRAAKKPPAKKPAAAATNGSKP